VSLPTHSLFTLKNFFIANLCHKSVKDETCATEQT